MLGNGRPFVIEFVRATAGPDPCLPSLAARVGVSSPAAVVSLSAVALPLLRAWPLRRSIVRTRATPSAARSIGAGSQSAARAWTALSPSTRRMRRSIRRLSRAGGGRSRGAAVRPFVATATALTAVASMRTAAVNAGSRHRIRWSARPEVPTVGGADGRRCRRSEVPTVAAAANGAYSRATRRRATCGEPYTVRRTLWRRKCSGRHAPPRSESADLRVVGGGCRGHQAERCLTGTVISVTDLSGAGLSGTHTHTHTHTHKDTHTHTHVFTHAQYPLLRRAAAVADH
jgi:hypothetical protein